VARPVLVTINAQVVRSCLDRELPCPACGVKAMWHPVGRPGVRANSVLYRFGCDACDEQIVVKLARSADPGTGDGIKREYDALRRLQGLFPPEDGLAVLTPLACLEMAGHAALVTLWFEGRNAIHYDRNAGSADLVVYRSAGLLLRKLHDVFALDDRMRPLDVESKVAYLSDRYAKYLRGHRAGTGALDILRNAMPEVTTSKLEWSWTHGDFKPENILYDGQKVVVLDTQLNVRGAGIYDIAPFLDHTLLASRAFGNRMIRNHYALLEREFLAGYGGLSKGEMAALRWAQLYFMLCYLGRYRSRGVVASVYAQYKVAPLLDRLVNELRESIAN